MKLLIPLAVMIGAYFYRHKLAQEWKFFRARRKEWFYDKWKNWGEPFLIAAVLALLIRTFLLGPAIPQMTSVACMTRCSRRNRSCLT